MLLVDGSGSGFKLLVDGSASGFLLLVDGSGSGFILLRWIQILVHVIRRWIRVHVIRMESDTTKMYPNHGLNVQITERYLLSATPSNASTAKYARPGELFGRIELNSELSEDSKVRVIC